MRPRPLCGGLEAVLEDWTPRPAPLALDYPGRKDPPADFTPFIEAAREFATANG